MPELRISVLAGQGSEDRRGASPRQEGPIAWLPEVCPFCLLLTLGLPALSLCSPTRRCRIFYLLLAIAAHAAAAMRNLYLTTSRTDSAFGIRASPERIRENGRRVRKRRSVMNGRLGGNPGISIAVDAPSAAIG
jgi:hypothetical protein